MTSYNKNSPETIQAMFGSIAKRYDTANAINSLQMHKRWNRELLRRVGIGPSSPALLDLCCGTGDIAFAWLKQSTESRKVYMLDFCDEMLSCAKLKADKLGLQQHEIDYIQADAQNIPLPSASVPFATVAYGIRNVKDPLKCMQEVYRVLQPGGVFGILELTRPTNPIVKLGHQLYLKTVLPLVGKWLTSNREAYDYLCRSIDQFIPPAELESMLKSAGFTRTSRKTLACGIATILVGRKALFL